MSATDIIMIGMVAGFTLFVLFMGALTVATLMDKDDAADVPQIPETFELPRKLHEIEEEEKSLIEKL